MLNLLSRLNVISIGPHELEQFIQNVSTEVKDSKLEIRTDEIDISAFIKIMFDRGARIEIYSSRHSIAADTSTES
jgi:hypothetical protein